MPEFSSVYFLHHLRTRLEWVIRQTRKWIVLSVVTVAGICNSVGGGVF